MTRPEVRDRKLPAHVPETVDMWTLTGPNGSGFTVAQHDDFAAVRPVKATHPCYSALIVDVRIAGALIIIGELCNMICGDLKSRLCDEGFNCELSIPSITTGKEFKIESRGWDRSEQFGFRSNDNTALVAVYMKSVN